MANPIRGGFEKPVKQSRDQEVTEMRNVMLGDDGDINGGPKSYAKVEVAPHKDGKGISVNMTDHEFEEEMSEHGGGSDDLTKV